MASSVASAPQATHPQQSTPEVQPTPTPENMGANRDKPLPLPQKTPSQSMQAPASLPKEKPRPAQNAPVLPATTIYDDSLPSQPSPLARTTHERENTTIGGDSRLLLAQKMARNDQVVQEVVRLFKAEVKNIELK
jgi:hypothetical protein